MECLAYVLEAGLEYVVEALLEYVVEALLEAAGELGQGSLIRVEATGKPLLVSDEK